MPDEKIPADARIVMDRPMRKMLADYFAAGGLNPERLVIQAGRYNAHYIYRVRFLDLWRMSANGAQKIYLTVEHLFDRGALAPERVIIAWALERAFETLPMAHSEWVDVRKQSWPIGYPKQVYRRTAMN